jgi:hypothetical protein
VEHYVTLIDSLFLPQALALHRSMRRHCAEFTLWVLCVDDEAHGVLRRLAPDSMRLLRLAELETPALLQARHDRTRGEYCWTLTPFSPDFVFDADASVQRVTYIDADLWFMRNPAPIFDELSTAGRSVLITEHAYAPEYDRCELSGRFCVQFMSFERNRGKNVREWWQERCLEWCYARYEDGRFGDQKYLDDWPERFAEDVHILVQPEFTLAPWNAVRFEHDNAVFYHFHGLRLMHRAQVLLASGFELPRRLQREVYLPYLRDLSEALELLRGVHWDAPAQDARMALLRRVHNLLNALRKGWPDPWSQGKVMPLPLARAGVTPTVKRA